MVNCSRFAKLTMIYYTHNLQLSFSIRGDRMDNYLLLQKNSRVSLLVRYADRYHIIAVNNKLDDDKEEKVLAGNCSDAVIDEMGLTRVTIMTIDLRGVAIGGCCAGDIIVLYTKDKKLKYVLSDDYSDEEIKAMFTGIERFRPPQNGGSKSRKADWRTEMQTESMRKVMGPIGVVLNLCGCVCLVGTSLFGRHSVLWSTFCLLVTAISIGLYLLYPQYFSIMVSKEYKRVGYTAKVKYLEFAIMAPALALTLRSLRDYSFPNWIPLLIAGVVVGFAATIIMYIFSKEVRENTSLIVVVLLLSVIVSSGIVGQLNHLANFGADEPQTCTVIDTEREDGGRHADRYYCTVALASGSEVEVPISGSVYNKLQSGDLVTVYIGQGAFGIEYAYFVEIE